MDGRRGGEQYRNGMCNEGDTDPWEAPRRPLQDVAHLLVVAGALLVGLLLIYLWFVG